MKKILLLLVAALALNVSAQTYQNPVLRGVADAGVIKYAGKYYLGGVATMGDFFVSSDLVNWDQRIHVYDFDTDYNRGTGAGNNQVHSDDIVYSGGLFHLLYSANYWGRDRHIVHIIHATSPNIEGPFYEDRDDQWFENRIDPQVFRDEDGRHYLYMVKFTDGNTIWARPMNDDFSFAGDAVQQFASQQGTWETMDNRVAEGPFVIKYHGRYYMMYNANHTAAQYGNYRLGISEATSPMGFNPGNKYPYPVVSPQTDAMEEQFTDLLRYGSGVYTAVDLTADTIRFNLSPALSQGEGAGSSPLGRLGGVFLLKLAQRGGIKLWLNGRQVETDERADYRLVTLDASWLKQGENTIILQRPESVQVTPNSTEPARRHASSQLVALALYDLGTAKAPFADGDMLLTPGQPNIVRGPNGWEWWLVYMANQGFRRDQYIDRIHFVNDRLTVNGITGHNTPNPYTPAKPQYSGTSLSDVTFADSYLLEATIRPKGTQQPTQVWRIEKNHDVFTAWCDNVLVYKNERVPAGFEDLLRAEAAKYDVEYLSYNEGWDEYAGCFSGWPGLQADVRGLLLSREAFKGGAARDYAFTVSIDNGDATSGRYGVYAAYVDAKNYVRTTIDVARQMLVTEVCRKGKTTVSEAPLAYTAMHYPDLKYTDSFEKQYRFDSDTYLSEFLLPHLDADNDTYAKSLGLSAAAQRSFTKDMAARFHIDYLDGDKWKKLDYEEAVSDNPAWQRLVMKPVKTRALRFINADPEQHARIIYKIQTTRAFEQRNQLRVEKRGDQLAVYVNNRPMATVDWQLAQPARVGLYTDGTVSPVVVSNLYYPVY